MDIVFRVFIDYDFNGQRFTQVVTDGQGSPLQMQVTGSPCDRPAGMSAAALQHFRQQRYGSVHEPSVGADGSMTAQPLDPQEFVSGGCRS